MPQTLLLLALVPLIGCTEANRPQPSGGSSAQLPAAGAPETITTKLGIQMLSIPAGRFLMGDVIKKRAFAKALVPAHLDAEMTAQIGFLRDHGVPLSHVDSHGHVHKFGQLVAALERVLPAFGIRRVRR